MGEITHNEAASILASMHFGVMSNADESIGKLYRYIAQQRAASVRVKDGHVRLPDGREVRVVGVLPQMADGSIYGGVSENYDTERLWARHPHDGEVIECESKIWWSELDDWRVRGVHPIDAEGNVPCLRLSWCYSTREAAEAAAGEGAK